MKVEKQATPIEGEHADKNTELPEVKETKSKKRRVPEKDDDFGDLSATVNESWKANADITLRYIKQPEFELMVNNYNGTLEVRQETGGNRPPITSQLTIADAAIDDALSFVKLYIRKKYEKHAVKNYAPFGIQHIGRNYEFPVNREKRLNCLKMMKKAIVNEGFGEEKYGKGFWDSMYQEYKKLHKAAKTTDGTVSNKVGDKTVLKKKISTVLNSLINVLTGNHPETYAAVLREWGFQREKY